MGGCDTEAQAEAKRQTFKNKDLYTVATVMIEGTNCCSFVIPIKAVDLIMDFDEREEKGKLKA